MHTSFFVKIKLLTLKPSLKGKVAQRRCDGRVHLLPSGEGLKPTLFILNINFSYKVLYFTSYYSY